MLKKLHLELQSIIKKLNKKSYKIDNKERNKILKVIKNINKNKKSNVEIKKLTNNILKKIKIQKGGKCVPVLLNTRKNNQEREKKAHETIETIETNKSENDNGNIPKIIHLIWMGKEKENFNDKLNSWKTNNPSYTVNLWTIPDDFDDFKLLLSEDNKNLKNINIIDNSLIMIDEWYKKNNKFKYAAISDYIKSINIIHIWWLLF